MAGKYRQNSNNISYYKVFTCQNSRCLHRKIRLSLSQEIINELCEICRGETIWRVIVSSVQYSVADDKNMKFLM